MEIENIDLMDSDVMRQSFSIMGELLSFPVFIEDVISDAGMVMKRIYIGNNQIGHMIAGGGKWNVIQGENKVPFIDFINAIIYILKEEGYL